MFSECAHTFTVCIRIFLWIYKIWIKTDKKDPPCLVRHNNVQGKRCDLGIQQKYAGRTLEQYGKKRLMKRKEIIQFCYVTVFLSVNKKVIFV